VKLLMQSFHHILYIIIINQCNTICTTIPEILTQRILSASSSKANMLLKKANWYNSTEIPYSQGLKDLDSRLLGKKVQTIRPGGSLKVTVRRHSAEMFRLTSENNKNLKRYNYVKDEL
jgi:hypothetical protein